MILNTHVEALRRLQANNLYARWCYVIGMTAMAVIGVAASLAHSEWSYLIGVSPLVLFFLGLFIFNERLIRAVRRSLREFQ